jgi:hypothetical protein
MTLAAVPMPALTVGYAPAANLTGSTTPLRGADTAARLYDAEVNLHYARQSGIDPWILAAYDHLHLAVQAHAQASHLAADE